MTVRANRIGEGLPELLAELTAPLYAIFDFFTVPPETLRAEVAEMRGRR